MNFQKLKLPIILIIFISAGFLLLGSQSKNGEDRRNLLIQVIGFAIDNGHYDPGSINDDFSEKAWDLYMERLDYAKRFLLEEDINKLRKYRKELDDAFLESNFEFLDFSGEILDKRTVETKSYYMDILETPFDFTLEETYEFDIDKREFVKNEKELKERWRKSLKYETMTRLIDMLDEQEKATEESDTVEIKSFANLEIEAREKVLKRYDDWYHRMEKIDDDDRLNLYINSFVNVFDPHTSYFPPKDKENFDIRFSGQLEGIGAQLMQKNEYIEVSRIIPGSPSWKQGELEVGDYIIKVAQEDEEAVDVVDMRLDEAVLLIRGKKGTEVTLTVKKLDKSITEIVIVRDVVVLEETYAKSTVIQDPSGEGKLGYIKLPSFYVDFSKVDGRNCFNDVEKEIEKLKRENVNGIIFDLRDNGGGSLEDVVKIAGLFIEKGPIVQSQGKNNIKKVYKDLDPEIQYDGPLVVMVNSISASASEIFAAAMQDYERAVIIGSNSTFGKGTVQNFSDLDRMVPRKSPEMKSLGALKMSIQKFYRINGGATQLKGVTPDIILPDYYNYMDYGEKDMDNAMAWDEIAAVSYTKWTPSYDLDYISSLTDKRVGQDTMMMLIDENGKRLQNIRDESSYSLNFESFKQMLDLREEAGDKFERIGKDTLGLVINPLKADLSKIQSDTSRQALSDAWITGLKKDIYLYEAVNILTDIEDYKAKNAGKED